MAFERLTRTAEGIATALGGEAKVDLQHEIGYPATVNHPAEAAIATRAAEAVAGADQVETNTPPVMGAEDFAFMLRARPGAYILMGNGDTAFCHHPAYDFNDQAIPYEVKLLGRAGPHRAWWQLSARDTAQRSQLTQIAAFRFTLR